MTDNVTLDPRELLLAIDAMQQEPDLYTKEQVLKLLRIAAKAVSQMMEPDSAAVNAALAARLVELKPKGNA